MTRYRVVLERDESGAWLASVPKLRGCHSYGRSLVEAKRRIREALALWVDEAGVELDFDVRLPRGVLRAVKESKRARDEVESGRLRAARKTERAAIRLVERESLGLRDAADLLGLSHQRVQQILEHSRT